jgi:hypothetical protein
MSSELLPQPKIILEGTHLTLKTDIAFALAEHSRVVGPRKHRYHLPLVSAEWETFSKSLPTKSAPGRSLITFEPPEEPLAMETYQTWIRLFELQRYYYWIIDRFHISTRAYQLTHAKKDYSFAWLEERLAALDFHLVLCVRSPDAFEAARAERLTYSENPSQYDDLQVFVQEQELMRRLVRESRLRTLELDVSDNNTARAANNILDWMMHTGGLWPR